MTSDLHLDRLRAFHAADAALDPAARAVARGALLEQIEAAERRVLAAGSRAPRRRRRAPGTAVTGRRRCALVGGCGVIGLTTVALALLVGLPRDVEPPDAAATQLLHRAAVVAAQGPDVVLRRGQYWYTRCQSHELDRFEAAAHPFSVVRSVSEEQWLAPDGSGRVSYHSIGQPRFVGPGARAAWIADGRPRLEERGSYPIDPPTDDSAKAYIVPFGSGGLTYAQLRRLPTDPAALYDAIARAAHANRNSHGDAHEMFMIVGDLVRELPTPPALRAALYGVAARIPGVELIDRARDAAGRSGVAVVLGEPRERSELIFDPRTALLLGERETVDGRVDYDAAYFEAGVVGSTHARP